MMDKVEILNLIMILSKATKIYVDLLYNLYELQLLNYK